ncbi:hypothetical protein [Candidatus Methylacidiphilum fumarolicum]|nr:hypothetical protein [Candidatus Methylacidiphilum fumarolicum]
MNSYCYCDANLVMNRHIESIYAEEVWRANRSEHQQPVAQGDEKGSRPPTGLWQTSGIFPMSTSCG